jgi:serine phosphatase RsbU (regulator of sigma subunit)
MIFTPEYYNRIYIENNFYAKIITSILAPIFLAPIFYLVYILLNRSKSNSNTQLKFYVLTIFILFFHLVKIIDYSIITFPGYIIGLILLITNIAVFFISIFVINNNHWIAYQSKKIKYSLILNSLLIIFFLLNISFSTDTLINDYSSSISFTYDYYFYGLSSTVNLISLAGIVIFFRLIVTSIIYLPSSDAFERRQNEMISLASLNKIIAESKDINHITNTVTEIALKMTSSIFAWAEIYENDEIVLSSYHNTSEKYIRQILNDENFNKYRMDCNTLVIDDKVDRSIIASNMNYLKSMIYIPINDDNSKIGAICLVNNKKYNLDEDEYEILKAFSINVSIAFENVRLLKESIENEKYKNELLIAKNIQQNLLPKKVIQFEGYNVDAISIPADDVGGDYYDSVLLENGDKCYLIGDVSGKGIGAAIFMAQIKGMVMSLAPTSTSGKELLCKINSSLYGNIDKNMFVTISTITISNKRNLISYCRAGHTPLAIKKINEKIEFLKPKGFGIGFVNENMFNNNLEEIEVDLDTMDMIFAYSDGLNELRNIDNNEFGYENIRFILDTFKFGSALEINELFLEKAKSYSETLNQFDDLTLLTIFKNRENNE